MTRSHWWLGVLLLVAAVVGHAFLPRYEWHTQPGIGRSVRIDRWTGAVTWVMYDAGGRRWVRIDIGADLRQTREFRLESVRP